MATPSEMPFARPQLRSLIGILALLWFSAVLLIAIAETESWLPFPPTDPILTPFIYLWLFGGGSVWMLWRYRYWEVDFQALWGPWPSPVPWRAMLGVWITVFVFSIGAFQFTYGLFSWVSPDAVEGLLNQSLFLSAEDTALPGLYNAMMLVVLVVGAPILEEFLFRGVLLQRLAVRWGMPAAVILSSVIFGILHANFVGLSVFGLFMALVYLQTRSLGLAIAIHALNNAIAAGMERTTALLSPDAQPTLESFQNNWWMGLVLLAVATPFLVRYVRSVWGFTQKPLPYLRSRG
ncbi:MAG: CPBP family intramembrane metalloprotease [Leptolyngbyaceae cyanobacterium T60_A2020_046]|nr:CPBP family intramembrane metalloprotease [Leptolyngbyaceae cyanobacterium T60_A2020_046]